MMLRGAGQMVADECRDLLWLIEPRQMPSSGEDEAGVDTGRESSRGIVVAEWIVIPPDRQRAYLNGAQFPSRGGIGPGPAQAQAAPEHRPPRGARTRQVRAEHASLQEAGRQRVGYVFGVPEPDHSLPDAPVAGRPLEQPAQATPGHDAHGQGSRRPGD